MATLDCAHARSFHVAPSFFDKRGGERGFFFFFFYGCATAFRTSVFSRVIRLIMFYYRVERWFVRSNYFKIREWKIDEIEAIFTPRFPRPLLCLLVFKIFVWIFFVTRFVYRQSNFSSLER